MAAINKALRSIPIDLHAVIWTDSLGSILAIRRHMNGTTNLLRCEARPYLRAIKRIIDIRTKNGVMTEIRHVRSYTGARNLESVGNSEADRLAKWEALGELLLNENLFDINHMENELPFTTNIIDLEEPDDNERQTNDEIKNHNITENRAKVSLRPIHGDIRKTLKTHFMAKQKNSWAVRPTRGQLVRDYPKQTHNLIQHLWTSPTSATIKFSIEALNRVDPKNFDIDIAKTEQCTNCTRNQPDSSLHRLVECPAIADIWNMADEDIWKELALNNTFHGITTPRQKENNKFQLKLMEDLNISRSHSRQIAKLITRCDAWNPKRKVPQPNHSPSPPPSIEQEQTSETQHQQPQHGGPATSNVQRKKKQRTILELFTVQTKALTQNEKHKNTEQLTEN